MKVAVVALGGALGALARYGVALFVTRFWENPFPLSTFLINVTGSFVMGFFVAFATESSGLNPLWRLLIVTGFLGAYTTFSTFEYETHRLATNGAWTLALLNVLASVIAGFVAIQLGIMVVRR